MRIILDTDKKTITVPWNYSDKLEVMNKTIREAMGDEAKTLDFKNYIDDCWKYAMEHSDSNAIIFGYTFSFDSRCCCC